MTRSIGVFSRIVGMSLTCLLAAACSNTPGGRISSTASSQATAAGEIDAIVTLLDEGKVSAAKKRLKAGLKRDPQNPALMVLQDSITREPQDLLGPDSYKYTVRAGDTMVGLAQRLLGNRLKFYQLSRYNGIERPSALMAGQVLNIPARASTALPQKVEQRPTPAPPRAAVRAKPKAAAVAAAPPRATNPVAASQARSAGLSALNSGRPGQAVNLLSRAASLDPGNAAIARDLARARRIAATVGTK